MAGTLSGLCQFCSGCKIVYMVYNVYMGTREPTQFTASAFNHGISERQIREVLASDSGEDFELEKMQMEICAK